MNPIKSSGVLVEQNEQQLRELKTRLAGEYRRLLEATEAVDVAKIHEVAAFLQRSTQAVHGAELNEIAEFKLACVRKIGAMIRAICHRGGDRKSEHKRIGSVLKDLGIKRSQSSICQRASIPPVDVFIAWAKARKAEDLKITQKAWLKFCSQYAAKESPVVTVAIQSNRPKRPDLDEIIRLMRQLVESGLKFGCILMTPTWRRPRPCESDEVDVRVMGYTIEDLMALPIGELALDNSHVQLWVTTDYCTGGPDLLRRWGFEPKTSMALAHSNDLGVSGQYYKKVHSELMLGVRGTLELRNHQIPSLCQIGLYHNKPDESKLHRLLEATGVQPFLQLFGESPATGWTVLALQFEKTSQKNPGRRTQKIDRR